jgi:hypothetical protein
MTGTVPALAASGNDNVSAQNTILTVTQAKALSSAELLYGRNLNASATRLYNNVSGSVNGSAGTSSNITQTFQNSADWTSIKAGTIGSYDVTYSAGSSATATVKVAVVPDGSVTGPTTDDDDAIYSKTVIMKSADAKNAFGAMTSSRGLMSSTYNDVHAVFNGETITDPSTDETNVTQTFTNGDWDNIKAGTAGSYSVTYACGDAKSQKVRIIIVKDSATVTGLNDAVIADSVTVTSSEAKTLTEDALYGSGYNYVTGYYRANDTDIGIVDNDDPHIKTLIQQTIVDDDLKAIKAGTTGTYDVMYQIQDLKDTSCTSITPTVTVMPDDAVIVGNTGDAVHASSYITTSDAAKSNFAGKASDILYGTSTTGTSNEYNRVIIDQSNIILTDSDPTRKNASTQTIAAADWSAIQAGTEGQYDVKYAVRTKADPAKTDASQTAYVVIMPDGSNIDNGKVAAVHASGITLTATDAKALTKEALFGSSYNKVTAVKNGSLVSPGDISSTLTQTISDADWTAIKAGTAGSYDITYTVPGTSAKMTAKVTVVPDSAAIASDTGDAVQAGSYITTSSAAKSDFAGKTSDILYGTSSAGYNHVIIDQANSILTDSSTPARKNASAQTFAKTTDWAAIQEGKAGQYDVTYAVRTKADPAKTDASQTVHVFVMPDGSSVDQNNVSAVYAGEAAVTVTQAKTLTKAALFGSSYNNVTAVKNGAPVSSGDLAATLTQTIADADWASIEAGKTGSYNVTYKLTGTSTEMTAKINVVPDTVIPSYSVKWNVTAGSGSGSAAAVGSDFTGTITPSDGAELPEDITVSVGGKAITDFTYKDGKVTVPAKEVTGDITITAVCTYEVPSSGITGGDVTYNDPPENGKKFSGRIVPDAGYSLPKEITVTVGGKVLAEGQYTYNASTGAFTVSGQYVTGKVSVTAKGIETNVKGAAAAAGNIIYKVTDVSSKLSASATSKAAGTYGSVSVLKPVKKTYKSVSMPSAVTINGYRYNVTGIASKAFNSNTKITSVTVGKNVKTIGLKAFCKCSKLKTVRFAGKNVIRISSGAFKTCAKSCTFKIPKAKYDKYKKMLKKSGVPSGAKYKRI